MLNTSLKVQDRDIIRDARRMRTRMRRLMRSIEWCHLMILSDLTYISVHDLTPNHAGQTFTTEP